MQITLSYFNLKTFQIIWSILFFLDKFIKFLAFFVDKDFQYLLKMFISLKKSFWYSERFQIFFDDFQFLEKFSEIFIIKIFSYVYFHYFLKIFNSFEDFPIFFDDFQYFGRFFENYNIHVKNIFFTWMLFSRLTARCSSSDYWRSRGRRWGTGSTRRLVTICRA